MLSTKVQLPEQLEFVMQVGRPSELLEAMVKYAVR
jgi:hypothetical protein